MLTLNRYKQHCKEVGIYGWHETDTPIQLANFLNEQGLLVPHFHAKSLVISDRSVILVAYLPDTAWVLELAPVNGEVGFVCATADRDVLFQGKVVAYGLDQSRFWLPVIKTVLQMAGLEVKP